jgi:hypothetical protein
VGGAAGRRPNLRSLGPHLSQGLWYVPGWRVRRRWLPASMTAGGSIGQGGGWRNGQAVANAVHRVEMPWQKLCSSWADDGDVSRRRFFSGSIIDQSSSLCAACLPWVKTWTFWSGDGGASGVAFLLGGVVLEDCAQSVYCGGQRRGKKGGGLVEDSSLWCQRRRNAVKRRALAWRLEGLTSAGSGPRNWRGGHRGGAHEVGREVGMGGGGQQI